MATPDKRVWVLGSGFSKSLGGPLLSDLFRPRWHTEDELDFPETEFPELGRQFLAVRVVYSRGRFEGLWENAEQFLVRSDIPFAGDDYERMQNLITRSVEHFDDTPGARVRFGQPPSPEATEELMENFPLVVRRCFAAECTFVKDNDTKDERWDPYRAWMSQLSPVSDTIVSFNYDNVVEKVDSLFPESKVKVLMPSKTATENVQPDFIPLLKLHGSITWHINDSLSAEQTSDPLQLLKDKKTWFAIAAPGRSKVPDTKPFENIWHLARVALRNANRIIFLGYSFPPSDSYARMEVLRAIRSDKAQDRDRHFHIIQGQDTSRPDVRRVEALLRSCASQRRLGPRDRRTPKGVKCLNVNVEPLLAEDFIADMRERLPVVSSP